MRKPVLVICLFSLFALWAAPVVAQGTGFAVKGGVAWTDLRGEFDSDFGRTEFDGDLGFAVGAALEVGLSSSLSLRPEALFVRKRVETVGNASGFGPGPGPRVELGVEVDYLEVPVLLVYQPQGAGGLRPSLFAGPTVSFKLDATGETRLMGEVEEEDIAEDIEDIDLGIALGGGLAFGDHLTLDARWVLGLTDAEAVESEIDLKWSTAMLLLGYRF